MKDRLYLRYSRNDLKRNWGVNTALMAILVLSAFLMATGCMVMERLLGGINQLFEEAKPPHFLQMHTGDYDPKALDDFAATHPEIDSWFIEDMVGYDSSSLTWSRSSTGESGSLAASLIDNLFITQNKKFDHLLDGSGTAVEPGNGEVYVPVAYQEKFGLQVGDTLSVQTDTGPRDFTISGFVRDSQMASSLSSATRFVISPDDFAALGSAGGGSSEIIVEYRLADASNASALQTAYDSDHSLPRNGPAVTFDMIRLINAFSDGLVAVALVFASLLLVVIALINLRFVIRGTMEDEVREIGVMRAIGLPARAVTGLYLGKYSIMAFLACVIGGLLGIFATNLLTASIVKNYSASAPGPATVLTPVIALALVYLLVVGICRGILRGIRRIEVVNALVHGSTLNDQQTARKAAKLARRARSTSLSAGHGSINRRLSLADLRAEMGQWILIPLVFFLTSLLLILPMNLLSTFSSPRFVTYMGAPESDIRADVQFSKEVEATRGKLVRALENDQRLTNIRTYANVLYETRGKKGWETLRVEVGDYSANTVKFLTGSRPENGQIALSTLNAKKYNVKAGDTMTIRLDGQPSTVTISGTYQDVTSGGHTAKMQGSVTEGAASYVIYAETVGGADPMTIAAEYDSQYKHASIVPMQEYVKQTLSYVTDAFRSAALLSLVFGLAVSALITGLFLKLRLTRERRRMGVLSALGFSRNELISQVRLKTVLTVAVGTIIGTVFAATLGEGLISGLISLTGIGLTSLSFIPDPLLVYIGYPLLLITVGFLASVPLTAGLRRGESSEWLTK